jgi:hypothetical protein
VVDGVTVSRWNARTLESELRSIGTSPLCVALGSRSGRLIVFLHAPAGLTQQENALQHLRTLDGIETVEVSEWTWTILRVDVLPE